VRIDGWHIDGFGTLKDYRVEDLPDGVTVLLGENEAGKSTLLGFLRAMLFGFPDGRTSERQYPPVVGGRHGGRISLRDDETGVWTLERYADKKKTLLVTAPDGRAGDAADLQRLLGGADARLFKSVFAFSLDELQGFGVLGEEGVRDRIFSAGITGAGKSARDVMKRFGQQTQGLLKQGRGQAEINDLVRELNDTDDRLRVARGLAAGYDLLVAAEREHERSVDEHARRVTELQRRRLRVQTLIELRPDWEERESLRLELAELPAVDDETLPDRVAGATDGLAVLAAHEERLFALEAEVRSESAAVAEALERLGPAWSIERVRGFDDSLSVHDAVRTWSERFASLDADVSDRRRTAEAGAEKLAELETELRTAAATVPDVEPRDVPEIERREALVRGLRTDLTQLRMAEIQAPDVMAPNRSVVLGAGILAGVSAVGTAITLALGLRQASLGLAIATLLLTAFAAIAAIGARGGKRAPAPAAADAADDPHGRRGSIGRLRDQVSRTAGELGLSREPSMAELDALEAALRREQARLTDRQAAQVRVDELQKRIVEAGDKAARATKYLNETLAARDDASAQWAAWCRARDLDDLAPAAVLDTLTVVGEARTTDGRLTAALAERDAIVAQRAAWELAAREALVSVSPEAAALEPGAVRAALSGLHEQLQRRDRALERVAELERTIATRLGGADDVATAMDELATGDTAAWHDETHRLDDDIGEATGERDQAIERRRDAQREREQLERSADVPSLETLRESLRAQLAVAVTRYRVLAAASGLIGGTLQTYVRDRQPAVLAGASQAFAQVTGGRYVRVEQDDAADTGSVVVVSARDEARLTPDQLSRGTAEQLYLTIRLAVIAEFARRSVPLPLIMDDCLVNFDPTRAAAMARLLSESSRDAQCLLFTCHPATADLMVQQSDGGVRVLSVGQ
jgi:uncharacterized protein YhaN